MAMPDEAQVALPMPQQTIHTLLTPSGVKLTLQPLTAATIPAVMSLESEAHTHPWRLSSFEDCLKGRQQCWLAYVGDRLAGYVVFTHGGGDAELLNIVVAKVFQRRGIASCLIGYAVDCLKAHAQMLFLEVRVSNHKAVELYAKESFFEVGQRRNYYPTANGHEDALIMARQL
jgi:ribosomal-protein-alanine N-acetyltransferase